MSFPTHGSGVKTELGAFPICYCAAKQRPPPCWRTRTRVRGRSGFNPLIGFNSWLCPPARTVHVCIHVAAFMWSRLPGPPEVLINFRHAPSVPAPQSDGDLLGERRRRREQPSPARQRTCPHFARPVPARRAPRLPRDTCYRRVHFGLGASVTEVRPVPAEPGPIASDECVAFRLPGASPATPHLPPGNASPWHSNLRQYFRQYFRLLPVTHHPVGPHDPPYRTSMLVEHVPERGATRIGRALSAATAIHLRAAYGWQRVHRWARNGGRPATSAR